jgi:hypothetical protein
MFSGPARLLIAMFRIGGGPLAENQWEEIRIVSEGTPSSIALVSGKLE